MEVVLLAWIGRVGKREEGFAQAPFCKKRPRSDLKHRAFDTVCQVLPACDSAKLQSAETVAHRVD